MRIQTVDGVGTSTERLILIMKKEARNEQHRLFKVSHQILCITGINFNNRSLVGYVELTVWPSVPDLTEIRLNCKQCMIYRISVDKKWNADYTYYDPTLNICQGNTVKRNIDYFQKCQRNALSAVDPDLANGEVVVALPPEVLSIVSALGNFQVCIEFALEQPKGGVHFVVPDLPGTMAERSAHMFTYGVENFSRMWFPCLDSFSEPCTWKIEVTVDRDMTAISCGDLVSVEYTEDMMEKTYHYFLSSPVAAPNIALAVGPFEILVDPKMHEVTHFCPPKLMPVLKHTTGYIHQAFEFYEELMSSRYPYSYYKQVFVDEAYVEVATYSTMSILSVNLLHPPNIIDQTMASRQLMATAVAQQFFGSFIAMESWSDAWLAKGITGYLSYMFCKRTFGNNEYRNWVMRDLQEVSEYEQQVGLVILDPSRREGNHSFSIHTAHTLSPRYMEIFNKKCRLVMRMLEIRIGTELLLQVLNKLLSLAYNASQQPFGFNIWTNMLLSTVSFLKIIYTVTGKDIEPFISQWVYQGGCARFSGSFVFNRKRNVVELDIRQELNAPGALKFVGTLNVTIQELDGSFSHQFKIEENKTKFEITCHSKSRRNKKKKIPLMTGEEVDMDLSAMDADSPVLWLRLDPDMHLLRSVNFEQPDYMWQYQLKFERCIVAQFEAIEALGRFPTAASRLALTDTIENEECYYRVRQDACYCLAKIANMMVGTWTGPPAMITIFRKMYGSHSCPFIIRQNNFSNFHHYYLLKTMPQAMARLRDTHNLCLPEITKFLLDLFKYNDNSRNKWSDNYFRAALVEALSASITPAVANVSLMTGQVVKADMLSADIKLVVEEVVRCLNLEKLMPCYKYTVTVSCLYTIRTLQKLGHLPNESDFFKDYTKPGIFRDVRVAALTCLVDFIRGDITGSHLQWTLDFIDKEHDPYLRHHAVTCLTQNPPFRLSERSPLNVQSLVERLWDLMCHTSHDCRLRCGLADLYFTLYGRQRPTCLPPPEQLPTEPSVPSYLMPSTGSAIWNPELSGLFSPPVSHTNIHGGTMSPSTVKVNLDLPVEDNLERVPMDLSMIAGEQVVTHDDLMLEEMTVGDSDTERDIKPVTSTLTSIRRMTSSRSRRNSVSRLSEDSLSPASSPAKGHPDDVIVSLDNIIKTDPSVPLNIFTSTSPPPAELKSSSSTASMFVKDELVMSPPTSPPLDQFTEVVKSPLGVSDEDEMDVGVKEEVVYNEDIAAPSPPTASSSPPHLSSPPRLTSPPQRFTSLQQGLKSPPPRLTSPPQRFTSLQQRLKSPPPRLTSPPHWQTSPPPRLTSPPQRQTSPPPRLTSPPHWQTSPPPRLTSLPQRQTSPPPRLTSPPQRFTSPPPRLTSPPQRFTLPPQRLTSPPPWLTSPQQQLTSPPQQLTSPLQQLTSPQSSPFSSPKQELSLPPSPAAPSPLASWTIDLKSEPAPPTPPPPPPQPSISYSSLASQPSPPLQLKLERKPSLTQSSPPLKRKLSFSGQDYSSPEIKKTIPPLIVSTSGMSTGAAVISTPTALPSLKTTFNLSAAVAASEARERESHHKSKKKKKKHKHKHKHKHRHDREQSSDRPRERLLLDMSELSRASKESPSVRAVESFDDPSSSE